MARLEKAYNLLSNAYIMGEAEAGESFINTYSNSIFVNWYEHDTHKRYRDYFRKYIKTAKVDAVGYDTFSYVNYLGNSTGSAFDSNSYASFIDTNGILYIFRAIGNSCASSFGSYSGSVTCGPIIVDVSGRRLGKGKIRTAGKHVFVIDVTKNGVKPGGYEKIGTASGVCTGLNCTAWVLTYKNMDYLHCKDLSWNGKTKCK